MEVAPNAVGLGLLFAVLLALAGLAAARLLMRRPLKSLLRGKDGYPSLALTQGLIWLVIIVTVFSWIYFIRLLSGVSEPPGELPANILAFVAIIYSGTLASAQVSTLYPEAKGKSLKERENKPEDPSTEPSLRTMLEEGGRPTLGRIQMLIWTIVSVVIYLVVVYLTVTDPTALAMVESLAIPDIDASLMVLMGLSQAGYVGSKAISVYESRRKQERGQA